MKEIYCTQIQIPLKFHCFQTVKVMTWCRRSPLNSDNVFFFNSSMFILLGTFWSKIYCRKIYADVTTQLAGWPLSIGSDPLAQLVRALARESGCTISPGSNPSGVVHAGTLHWGLICRPGQSPDIDSSPRADWLSCFWPSVNAGLPDSGVWCPPAGAIEEGRNMTTQLDH